MNNRPTPETDAAASPHIGFYSCATVTANFARRLEIERDEAREDRENSRQSLAFALEELDEARKEAHRFRSLHYSHLGINASASWFPWEEKLGHE
jgi:hypothetical protein